MKPPTINRGDLHPWVQQRRCHYADNGEVFECCTLAESLIDRVMTGGEVHYLPTDQGLVYFRRIKPRRDLPPYHLREFCPQ